MKVSTKTIDPSTTRATISLDKDELLVHIKHAKEHIMEHLNVEGFRKGKVPANIAEQHMKEDVVRSEALEFALEDSFSKAVIEQKWDVMNTTDLKVEKNDPAGLEFSLSVHLWPTVKLAELESVKVPRKAVEVSEKEIDEALDTVANMRATFLDKTGPAVQGDRVEIDFDASIAGEAVEGGSSRNHPLVIGGKNFMPGFEEQLVGLSAGEKKDFTLTAADDYYEPKLAGKKIDFTVTMHKVQAVLKPAADDAFAKSFGKFENLAQLRGSLQEGIYNEKQDKEKQRLRLAILDAIIKGSDVPAPEELVKAELDDMLRRFNQDLQQRGIELTMYLARLNKTEESMRAEWKTEAERQVRIMLVLRAVAQAKSIVVPPAELEAALNETVGELVHQGQMTEDQIDPQRIRSALAERLLRDKVLNFIEGVCAQ